MHTAGVEVWGFHSSVSHTKSKMEKVSSKSNVKNVKISVFNRGSIDFSGLPACAKMGSINAPVMVDQWITGYWKLPQLNGKPELNVAQAQLKAFSERVYAAANVCRKAHCGGKGDCMPNAFAWRRLSSMPAADAGFFL